jgi:hypothetical protein
MLERELVALWWQISGDMDLTSAPNSVENAKDSSLGGFLSYLFWVECSVVSGVAKFRLI